MRGDTVCQAPTPTARSISVPRLTVDFELYGILRAYSAVLDASATTVGFGRDATAIEIPENVEKTTILRLDARFACLTALWAWHRCLSMRHYSVKD